MNNKKSTKRALLTSLLSMVLCLTMLIGTTFAWFTDSVTSGNNIIKSGTLDVEMSWADAKDGTFKDASEGAIFDYKLWEPGYTQVKYIKVDNVGDLAFQYQLNVIPNIDDANADADLAEVIDVYTAIVDGSFTAPTNFAEVEANMLKMGTLTDMIENAAGADTGVILPKNGSTNVELPAGAESYEGTVTVCVALHMQETAGNEYQNLSVGEGFSVQLLATQYTWEKDSFDNQYDVNAEYDENQAKPQAKVTYAKDLINVSTAGLEWNDSYSMVDENSGVEFDTAYKFVAPVDGDTAAQSPYATYLADFAVSFDQDITPAEGVGIAGEYGSWGWIGFLANQDLFDSLGIQKLDANVAYDLLGSFGITMDYEDLCYLVKEFTCAAWADNAEGTTMTVELRLYETYSMEESVNHTPDGSASANVKTGDYIVIGTYTHTF